ncbi:hypothetical protein ACPA9J_22040 [Pseudomonas aeruginosa]
MRPHQRETLKPGPQRDCYAPKLFRAEAGSAVPGLFVLLKGVVGEARRRRASVRPVRRGRPPFDVRSGCSPAAAKHRYLAIEETHRLRTAGRLLPPVVGEGQGFARFFQGRPGGQAPVGGPARRSGTSPSSSLHASPASTCCRRWRWRPPLSLGDAARLN